ncbi:hypothetical protein, partial [Rhodopseudomonas sp. BAL398]|uniref:hypothetical protein n=1 Tax=Rhodopseudomonas sp. BAL398 TaxID=3034676 RepID=UPI0023E2FFAA
GDAADPDAADHAADRTQAGRQMSAQAGGKMSICGMAPRRSDAAAWNLTRSFATHIQQEASWPASF